MASATIVAGSKATRSVKSRALASTVPTPGVSASVLRTASTWWSAHIVGTVRVSSFMGPTSWAVGGVIRRCKSLNLWG